MHGIFPSYLLSLFKFNGKEFKLRPLGQELLYQLEPSQFGGKKSALPVGTYSLPFFNETGFDINQWGVEFSGIILAIPQHSRSRKCRVVSCFIVPFFVGRLMHS